jgi:8-oxo-dGTP pyrophosphatase MutT (NUDIX family)
LGGGKKARMTTNENTILCQHRWMSLGIGDRGEPFMQIAGDGVIIVPLTEHHEIVMIVEPSVTTRAPVVGLPAGVIDLGETSLESANRELQEESGYKSEQLDYLGTLHPLSRHSNWKFDVYLGRKLVPSKMIGDEDYEITIKKYRFEQIKDVLAAGEIDDSNVIAALYLAQIYLERERA